MPIQYDTNLHSVFLLQYRLVLVTKYRKKVISKDIEKRILEIFVKISKTPRYGLSVVECSSDLDHLNIIFKAQPKSQIRTFLNAFKSASSRLIKKEFPEVKKELFRDEFWSKSFFLATMGDITPDIIGQYIESQDFNHK